MKPHAYSRLATNHVLTVNITGINGQGIGFGLSEGKKIFVPTTAPGDKVKARIIRSNNKYTKAQLVEILEPAFPDITPPCPYFRECGGCSLQHLPEEDYLAFKHRLVQDTVNRIGYTSPISISVINLPNTCRRRVVFKYQWDTQKGNIGFYALESHDLVPIEHCLVAEEPINALIPHLRQIISKLSKPESITDIAVTYLSETECFDIYFQCKTPISKSDKELLVETFIQLHIKARISALHGNKLSTLHDYPVALPLGNTLVALPAQTFLQATKEGQAEMTKIILKACRSSQVIYDLYAGCGTFSFPLWDQGHQVSAYEGNHVMMDAASKAVMHTDSTSQNNINFTAQDLFKHPLTASNLSNANVDTVIINPPRNGAEPQMKHIAASKTPTILVVSCHLPSFERDAKHLYKAGYQLTQITAIDQFRFTAHTEIVAEFKLGS